MEDVQSATARLRSAESRMVDGYPRYSQREMSRRYQALRERMDAEDLGVVVVIGAGVIDSPVQYYSNWPSRRPSVVLVWPDREPEMIVRLWNHLPNARDISTIEDIEYGGHTHADLLEKLAARLASGVAAPRRVGVIGNLPVWDADELHRQVDVELVNLSPFYLDARFRKSEEELEYVRVASAMGDLAVAALKAEARPGLSETDLKAVVQNSFNSTRGEPIINFFLVASMDDPDRCVPRQLPTNRVLRPGDVVATEISAWYWGYSGQILRTLFIDSEPTDTYAKLLETAQQAYERLVAACRADVTVGELLDVADLIDAAGLSIWDDLLHGYGGGGYLSPVLRTNQTGGADRPRSFQLQADAVVIVQPNVITPDSTAGVQLGNGIVIREGSPEVLQAAPLLL